MKRQLRSTGAKPAHFALAILSTGLIIASLLPVPAVAVTISGSTYAANTGGPPPNPTSANYNQTNPTSVSANIRSDVTWSHAQSWASAYVTASGVTKTTGGRGWVDTPPTAIAPLYDGRSNLWNAYASGTQLVVSGPGSNAAMHFVIPANGIPAAFNAQPANLPTDPQAITPPANGQGIVSRGSIGPGSMPSFFDVFVQVDASAQQGGNPAVKLFQGSFLFDPNDGTYHPSGDFTNASPVITPGDPANPNAPQFSLAFPTDIVGGSFNPIVGQPFDATINIHMTMGDPNNQFPTVTPTPYDFTGRAGSPIGAGGAFASQFLLDNPSQFTLHAVPEPSTLALASLGALAAIFAVRRSRSG